MKNQENLAKPAKIIQITNEKQGKPSRNTKNNKAPPSAAPQGGRALRARPLGSCCLPFGKDFLCCCAFLGPRKADFFDNFWYDRVPLRPLLPTFRFSLIVSRTEISTIFSTVFVHTAACSSKGPWQPLKAFAKGLPLGHAILTSCEFLTCFFA